MMSSIKSRTTEASRSFTENANVKSDSIFSSSKPTAEQGTMASLLGNQTFIDSNNDVSSSPSVAMTTDTTYLFNETNSDPDISPGTVAGIVLACIAIAAIATIIIYIYYRRNRNNDSTVRVWQENSVHALPDLTKTRPTWLEDRESWSDESSDFNPDLEFQPVNIFRGPTPFMNSDDDSSAFDDSTQLPSKQADDKETVVLDPKLKSSKAQNRRDMNTGQTTDPEIDANVTGGQNDSHTDTADRKTDVQYTQVRKEQRPFKITANENGDHDLAKNINVADSSSDGDQFVVNTNQDIELSTIATECENEESHKSEEDNVYYNSEAIRRVRSVRSSSETPNRHRSSERAVGDSRESGASKPPKPLPRLSTKKPLDKNENDQRQSLTEKQIDTFMNASLPPGYDYVDETVFISNREKQSKEEDGNNVYAVPKVRNTYSGADKDDGITDDDSNDSDDDNNDDDDDNDDSDDDNNEDDDDPSDDSDDDSDDIEENVYDVPKKRENQSSVTDE